MSLGTLVSGAEHTMGLRSDLVLTQGFESAGASRQVWGLAWCLAGGGDAQRLAG